MSLSTSTTVPTNNNAAFTVIDSEGVLSAMIDVLDNLPASSTPSIYVDLEGINLSRQGTISILQLYISPHNHTYLVDVHELQATAFTTTGHRSTKSLKTILEAPNIAKVFFDVRNDSDALFFHYQIRLAGVQDIQLMELATRRPFPGDFVNGLQKCLGYDAGMTLTEKQSWNTE